MKVLLGILLSVAPCAPLTAAHALSVLHMRHPSHFVSIDNGLLKEVPWQVSTADMFSFLRWSSYRMKQIWQRWYFWLPNRRSYRAFTHSYLKYALARGYLVFGSIRRQRLSLPRLWQTDVDYVQCRAKVIDWKIEMPWDSSSPLPSGTMCGRLEYWEKSGRE